MLFLHAQAPEIYEEEPYSFKSDVWALGCVMYEVLTGKPAFGADNLSRVVIKVCSWILRCHHEIPAPVK